MRTTVRLLALFAAVVLAACSDGGEAPAAPPSDADNTGTGGGEPDEAVEAVPEAPELTITGPVPGTPQTSSTGALAGAGYVEEEYFVTGTARSFDGAGELADHGRWAVVARDEAPFTTRILVKRPADAAAASGVVLVEWNNVSAGFDSTPDWSYTSAEVLRSGHVHIAVSAQKGGVDADDGGGLAGGFGSPLASADPVRYGALSHPGDEYSYDLFGQIGALARVPVEGQPDPLAALPREHVIAMGESQSAFRLTSYINGIHPVTPVFDGFLVHSRGGGSAPIGSSDDGLSSSTQGKIQIRDDLEEPVLVFTTETDLTVLGYAAARQPDSERVRSWEIAGTAHADAYLLGGDPAAVAAALGCPAPVNDGPQHLALKAGLSHLVDWVVDDDAPPAGEPIELRDDGEIARDADGNAVGGIRLPSIRVPVATYSGDPSGDSVLCRIFGSTTRFSPEELQARYDTKDAYLEQFTSALDASVDEGFLLEADRETALAEASEVGFG